MHFEMINQTVTDCTANVVNVIATKKAVFLFWNFLIIL